MKTFCKYSLSGGGNFNPTNTLIKGFLSLLFITSTLTACNDADEAIPTQASNKLNITVGLNPPQSRAGIITGSTLADGSTIGILLDDGAETDYDAVNNIKFTASTQDAKQVWTPASDIVLSDTKGTLYAYYPYAQGTDLSAIPIETATQTDYLYATPVQNVNESNASVAVTMNHMLSNIKVSIARGTYVGTGNITKISVESDGFATGGTFNAAQATPAFSSVTGTGDEISRNVTATLGGTATDIMVVPTGTSKAVTFTATIDDVDYTVTSSDVELEEGNSYEYTLSLNSTFMSVASVAVNPWTSVPKGNLTLEKDKSGLTVNSAGKANGVYAVTEEGELIAYNDAAVDATCLGVALITDNQRIMIEKNEIANAEWNSNTTLYWGKNLYEKNVAGITETTDETVAKADFSGKEHTNAIIAAYTEHSVAMDARDMCKVLQTFNDGENNGGFTDWYIPACGQLYEIYTNKTNINAALTAMSSTAFFANDYWSSSELSSSLGWCRDFAIGYVDLGVKNSSPRVRFVRDI